MTVLFCLLVTFLSSFDLAEQLLQNKFFDWKHGLDCDEMNVFCDQMNTFLSVTR